MTHYKEFENCNLCEWKCGINRYEEAGVCRASGVPTVASSTLHPAPPSSYDAFLAGCNFRCLFCQNFSISTYPEGKYCREFEGYYEPYEWARKAVDELNSEQAEWISADRLFFTGGEPTIFLPWIEDVIKEAKKIKKDIKVNFDTNGFMTLDSLKRTIKISTSITFDIKAFSDEVFRQLTGAYVTPVLRNAEYLMKNAEEKIWEIRVMIIPEIHNNEIQPLADFIASIEPYVPVNFLAFRPNFIMEECMGANLKFMEESVKTAKNAGLKNVKWSGVTGIKGKNIDLKKILKDSGCIQSIRKCGECENKNDCNIKKYEPSRIT